MLKLSHILPPGVRAVYKPESYSAMEEPCPRAVIGIVPAATALHLAIAHQCEERLELWRAMDLESGVDDLTLAEPSVVAVHEKIAERSTLIIASSRSRWHQSLLEENDVWLRDFAGVTEVSDALKEVDIRYCQQPKDAQILCALLYAIGDGKVEDASGVREVPGLIIAWDLLGLFVGDEGVGPGEEGEEDLAEGTAVVRSDTTIQEYLSLISMLKQACAQIGAGSDGPTPTLVILEPQVTSGTEIPISTPVIAPATRGVDEKMQRHLKLVRGLEWILAPGYAEEKGPRTVVEITKVNDRDFQMDGEPPLAGEPPSDTERFMVSSAGDVIASFERREETHAPGKPWLDRVGSSYEWIPLQGSLDKGEA